MWRPDPLRNSGFSLIEVLIALVIIAVGLLGLAGLNVRAQQAEMESYQRAQALILLEDMASRVKANPGFASCYDLSAAGISYVGNGHDWADTGCDALADNDLGQWDALLDGSAEQTSDGASIGAMLGARGCITHDTGIYTISIAWQGLSATAGSNNPCAQDAWENNAERRVVSLNIRP